MQGHQTIIDRQRHFRSIVYALTSFTLALAGYLWLGFDRAQTIGYGVAAFLLLHLLNFRAMYARSAPPGDERARRRW
ncbi:MAG: hypothetical protein HYY04_12145 [Chloroflexi bacterium]|nr:hypothetical protein [Chloroflexota bacterium]